MENEYKELRLLVKETGSVQDLRVLDKAWEYAKLAHYGQKRKSGDPYVLHTLETAKILAGWKMDLDSIVAGLMHDAIEDGGADKEDIAKEFGEEIAQIIDGVSKVSNLKLRGSRDEEFVENLRKMFLSMAKDLRVVLVKLADRLHNMRTLEYLSFDKQIKIARETLDIYSPLAERLGMGAVKSELDNLAFPFVYKKEHAEVQKLSKIHYKKATGLIKKMKRQLLTALINEGIKAKIDTREKSLYSLWKKLERPEIDWNFDKIYDIVALRILLEEVAQCYVALGLVHSLFRPAPHYGVSDFIAQPKPNGYRSIHTKVFGPQGKIAEVQIRTFLMHTQAEHGIAAHWAYSEAKNKGASDTFLKKGQVRVSKKLSWVKQLADWQKEIKGSKEFLQAVKFDALNHRNFVFSPHGDVYDLPAGATPIDFAYAVHTKLGDSVTGAKVNGRIVPLDYRLKSGEVVEILKSKNPKGPNRDWLNFVSTTLAKREINKHLRKIRHIK